MKVEFGPTLPQLLATRSRTARVAAGALAVLILAGVVAIAIATRPDETAILVREPVTFNFVYGPQFQRVGNDGALVALRHADGGLFLDSFVVRDLRLAPYRGVISGTLPVYADGYMRALARRYREYEFVGEGRARINNAVGYQVTFRARIGTRRLYGRHFLLVEEEPDGRRRGVVLELASTPKAGTPHAAATGDFGALKTPLRSFRFGEERSGGTA